MSDSDAAVDDFVAKVKRSGSASRCDLRTVLNHSLKLSVLHVIFVIHYFNLFLLFVIVG